MALRRAGTVAPALLAAGSLCRSAAESAVVVEVEGLVDVHLDLGAVALGHDDLVTVAAVVGRHRAGGAAADGLDRGRLGLLSRRAGDRLLRRLVRGAAVRRNRRPRLRGSA